MNISPALGAFVAGLLLGESPFASQIQADIGSLRIIMVTLFFASIGMLLKPLWFVTHLHWIFLLAVVIFIRLRSVLGRRTGNERPPYDPYTRDSSKEGAPDGTVVALPRGRAGHARAERHL